MRVEDKEWLKNEFPQYIGRTLMKQTLSAYYKAEMLLNGWDRENRRSCSCQFRQLKEVVEKSYNNWLNNEKKLSDGQ